MNATQIITAGALASLILELVKWTIKIAKKDPLFKLPPQAYVVAIPVLSYLVVPALAWLGLTEYSMPADWEAWGKQGVVVLLSSLTALATHGLALSSLSDSLKWTSMNNKWNKVPMAAETDPAPETPAL